MGIWDKFYEKAKSFFTGEEGTSDNAESAIKKKCYYELLEVERDANEEEIKKSFKKLALRWHPDKNPGREEECAAYFILIQQAYEVLSDPNERAFYDRHRENIIYANTEGPDERRDTGIVLEPYKSTSCWRGIFANEEERLEKFYSVYRDLFHQLAAEEYEYIEDPEDRNYPVFGTFTSNYENVVAPFYAFWLNFSTQRSFAWLDKWNLREAHDRYSIRVMEKENRKLREQGKKQRNEEVRELVEFVRKHDKRVEIARQRQKERNEEIRKRVEEQRRKTIRENLEKLETFEIDEEAHREHLMDLEQIEAALDAQFGTIERGSDSGEESDDEGNEEDLRCIVCEKSFKNKKVLESHQRSKKHRQMVEMLREHMREEDQQIFEDEPKLSTQDDDEEEETEMGRRGKRRRKRAEKKTTVADEANKTEDAPEEKQHQDLPQEQKPSEGSGGNKGKKARRRKGATSATAAEQKSEKTKDGSTGPVPSQCVTCGSEFESKSKLHAHLKESGHAALKTVQAGSQKKSEEKGKRQKGN